jgi:hypothetical protein
MPDRFGVLATPFSRERRFRRFTLEYPLQVRFSAGETPIELAAKSKNLSVGGLLLTTTSMIPLHTLIDFVMTIDGGSVKRPVHLRGEGEVVRVESETSEGSFAVAVQCTTPMMQIDEHLLARVHS